MKDEGWKRSVVVRESFLSRVLGFGGSSSRMIRRISSNAAVRSASWSNGVVPVSNSYSRTPSAQMSLRVSTSTPERSACSGLMYIGVPMSWWKPVLSVRSVREPPMAFATPKSMILGTAAPSMTVTRMFEGLRSRWMIPF